MPDWSNKELNGQLQGRRKDRQGWPAEKINRRRNLGGDQGVGKGEGEDTRGQSPSHTASHGVRSKERHTE